MANQKLIVRTPRGSVITAKTKSGTVRARLVWDKGFGQRKTRNMMSAQEFVDSEVLRRSDPYTPKRTGALIRSGVSVAEGDSIYYSSRPNADGVWKVSGSTRTDLVESLNENVANFFTIPVGKEVRATLTADTTAGTELTHILHVHEYFKG